MKIGWSRLFDRSSVSSLSRLTTSQMPPKKVAQVLREDTAASSDTLPRESRLKRGANHRDDPEEAPAVAAIPSVRHTLARPCQSRDTDNFQFDISSLSHASLQKYRKVMHLPTPSHNDAEENPPKRFKRVEKQEELESAVKRHWSSTQCKETEVITSFFYSIKNQDKTFKLRFVDTNRN